MAENRRETGVRLPGVRHKAEPGADVSGKAAGNKPPKGIGNSEPVDDNDARTRHSDGVNPKRRTDTQKYAGAGPAIAKRSKDAGGGDGNH